MNRILSPLVAVISTQLKNSACKQAMSFLKSTDSKLGAAIVTWARGPELEDAMNTAKTWCV